MPPKKKPAKRTMTDDHKAALAEGRSQGNAVRAYLEALAANRPKRGRKRTAETVQRQLEEVTAQLAEADPLNQLHLTQRLHDLQDELKAMDGPTVDLAALEESFVEAAAGYASRKKIGYAAFRSVGVPPAVLKRAGISRSA